MNSASDGHNSGDEGDADPEVLIVGTILSDLGGGSFVQVRGGFGGAVEIKQIGSTLIGYKQAGSRRHEAKSHPTHGVEIINYNK